MKMETTFEVVNQHSAGVDMGAGDIFVSTDGKAVKIYETFTSDYHQCIAYLKEQKIERVAMEATGVYWIAFYELLEQNGFEVCLVNPKETKQVKGRKSDVSDCQWIQKLFAAGLLRQSYIPSGRLKELRMLMREREDIIDMGSAYVNKMQKALELMNIKLTNVISQIHGVSGIKMIEAILAGERDAEVLLELCDKRIIKNKSDEIKKALEGNYNPSWLFLLAQNLKMWKIHETQVLCIDKKIDEVLKDLNRGRDKIKHSGKEKPIRHHKPEIEDLQQKLVNLYGTDVSSISGLTNYSLLKLVGETGIDLKQFPTAKHFVSWCQLSPRNSKSGKMNRKVRTKNKSKAGQIFREAAQSLMQSKNIAIGAFMRKVRSKKGGIVAVKAGARKIAVAYFNMITKGIEYVEEGVRNYEARIKQRELKLLTLLANKHQFKLVDYQAV